MDLGKMTLNSMRLECAAGKGSRSDSEPCPSGPHSSVAALVALGQKLCGCTPRPCPDRTRRASQLPESAALPPSLPTLAAWDRPPRLRCGEVLLASSRLLGNRHSQCECLGVDKVPVVVATMMTCARANRPSESPDPSPSLPLMVA